jgi:hypothetical protein
MSYMPASARSARSIDGRELFEDLPPLPGLGLGDTAIQGRRVTLAVQQLPPALDTHGGVVRYHLFAHKVSLSNACPGPGSLSG